MHRISSTDEKSQSIPVNGIASQWTLNLSNAALLQLTEQKGSHGPPPQRHLITAPCGHKVSQGYCGRVSSCQLAPRPDWSRSQIGVGVATVREGCGCVKGSANGRIPDAAQAARTSVGGSAQISGDAARSRAARQRADRAIRKSTKRACHVRGWVEWRCLDDVPCKRAWHLTTMGRKALNSPARRSRAIPVRLPNAQAPLAANSSLHEA